MSMTIQSGVKDKILVVQSEASKVENVPAEMLHGLDQQMEKKEDGGCLLQQPEIPEWKWDRITMDYITKLPREVGKTVQKALGTRLDMSTAYHPQKDGQSERTILIPILV
ncbi:putative reverse transcriptase domain-containing protein [Tanacetum coccineum]